MEPTYTDIQIAKEVVKSLFERKFMDAITYHLFRDEDWNPGYDYYNIGIYDWERENKDWLFVNHIAIYNGETKAAIVVKTLSNWVVKIGFQKRTDKASNLESTEFIDDYCALEYKNYCRAKEKGLERFFASMYQVGEIDGVPYYLQEYAENDEDVVSGYFYSYCTEEYDECEGEDAYNYVDDMDDGERMMAMFGSEFTRDLEWFCWDNEINDLHSGNFGLTRDGIYVIIDYSGYHPC